MHSLAAIHYLDQNCTKTMQNIQTKKKSGKGIKAALCKNLHLFKYFCTSLMSACISEISQLIPLSDPTSALVCVHQAFPQTIDIYRPRMIDGNSHTPLNSH